MIKFYKLLLISLFGALAACGGGGGDPGSNPTTPSTSKNPVISSAAFVDSTGVATSSIGASGITLLKVKLNDPTGKPIANQIIDVTGDASKVVFPEGSSALTDSSGVATIKVARASLVATGAGSLAVTYSYKVGTFSNYPDGTPAPTADTVVAAYVGYQLATANVTLVNLDVGASSLAAYGTRQISVQANLNGVPTPTPVQVNFTATCGQVSPLTASTDNAGKVVVSYSATDAEGVQSTQGCSGKAVEISASTVGAAIVTKSLNILAAPATNMSFDSAVPSRIYLKNSGGPTQAVVAFKLVNARGEPLLGQDVELTLKTLNGGLPKAAIGAIDNINPVRSTTDAAGKVSVPVFSGTVPTNVIVNAALVSNPAIQTDSAVLAIASGRPAQARASLSIEALAIEGFNTDGTETSVTMSLADRQGNPVPDGTAVNFVTSGGVMIPPTCTTGAVPGDSRCTVKIRSQNPRVAAHGGRVQILAYAAGEEDFVDANFNNVYDCGESWFDLATAFRDDNANRAFDTGEFSVPRTPSVSTCASAVAPNPLVGDGVWGTADVRMQGTIVFATSAAVISGTVTAPQLNFTVADGNGNSMPFGTKVEVSAAIGNNEGDWANCTIQSNNSFSIGNTIAPTTASSVFVCDSGDVLTVKVTSPLGVTTSEVFIVP